MKKAKQEQNNQFGNDNGFEENRIEVDPNMKASMGLTGTI